MLEKKLLNLHLSWGVSYSSVLKYSQYLVDLFGVGNDPVLHSTAASFMRLRALSSPAVVSITALNGSLRGVGDATSALYAAMLSIVVNLVFDVFLIFGPPRMGQNGAAIATAIAETCTACYLCYKFLSKQTSARNSSIEGGDAEDNSFDPYRCNSTWHLLAGTTAYIGHYSCSSSDALGAHQILKQLYVVLSFATDALAIAAQHLIATAIAKTTDHNRECKGRTAEHSAFRRH
jgi:Na+-driven multidrug efflux pump